MPWFKVDDKLHDHRKARAAGCAAMGLWTLAGSWAADNVTDGFVPESVCTRWDASFRKLAGRLVTAGLWEVGELDGEPGWWFHDWKDEQPSRAEVLAKRAAARDRMAKARATKGDGSRERSANVQANDTENSERSSREVRITPSRPDPVSTSEGSKGGDRRVPLREADATGTPKCSKHPNGDHDGPCAGCAKVREHQDRLEDQAAEARRRAIEGCPDCGGTSWIVNQADGTSAKCSHRRTA